MKGQTSNRLLRIVIVVLALADGVLHLLLDFILFGGRNGPPAGSRPTPPPGSPPPGARPFALPVPLNVLFLLNFIGEVVLVLLFWFGPRWLGRKRWLIDVIMIIYAAATFVAWVMFGRPNPMGLGYLSKGIEIGLIIALLVDIWAIRRQSSSSGEAPPKTP
jgi:hypothetical protein